MSQNYTWPAISVTATNPSVGTNGTTIPGSSTQVGGRLPSGNLSPVQLDNSLNLLVSVAASVLPTGSATSANQVTMISNQATMISDLAAIQTSVASLDSKTVHVDTGNVTVVSSTLPTGGATSALQTAGNSLLTTGNASLSSIDTKTPALGQALAAASVPVVLTALQVTALTPPTTVNTKAATPTALTVTQKAITVGTSAVRLTVSGSAPASTRVVLAATVDSTSVALFYIGASSVTNSGANRGLQIVAGQPFVANNDAGDYFIISDTASQTVYVMEQA